MLCPVASLKYTTINQCPPRVGSDGRGKAQWLGVQEGKLTIFVVGGRGGTAFIFQPGGLNQTICPVAITDNMTIKRRMTGVGLKRLWDGVAALVFQRGCLSNFRLEGV